MLHSKRRMLAFIAFVGSLGVAGFFLFMASHTAMTPTDLLTFVGSIFLMPYQRKSSLTAAGNGYWWRIPSGRNEHRQSLHRVRPPGSHLSHSRSTSASRNECNSA